MNVNYKLYRDPASARPGEFFKLPDDSPSYYRIGPSWPETTRMLERDVMVAGISLRERQMALKSWIRGRDRRILLKRERWNRHDSNAIAVIGQYASWPWPTKLQLGYIPTEVAADVAPVMEDREVQAWPTKLFPPRDDHYGGLRLCLGVCTSPPPLPSREPETPKPDLRERLDSFVKKHVAAPQKRPRKR